MEKGIFTKQFEGLIANWESDDDDMYIVEGTTVYDDGNEEFLTLVIHATDSATAGAAIYEEYEHWVEKITKMLNEIIEAEFEEGDHAVTLEKVTYGNDCIIALITCCS